MSDFPRNSLGEILKFPRGRGTKKLKFPRGSPNRGSLGDQPYLKWTKKIFGGVLGDHRQLW